MTQATKDATARPWETAGPFTERIKVEGGWLYHVYPTREEYGVGALTFVPDCAQSNRLRAIEEVAGEMAAIIKDEVRMWDNEPNIVDVLNRLAALLNTEEQK